MSDEALTVDEAAKFLDWLDSRDDLADDATLFHLALRLGLRRGELLALKWKAVSLDELRSVTVAGTLKHPAKRHWYVDTPKTASGHRVLPLPVDLAERLRRHRSRQNETRLSLGGPWNDHDFVFTRGDGEPLRGDSMNKRFQDLCAEAGLPVYRFHSTRSTAISTWAESGVELYIASKMAGHSSIAVTADIYARVRPQAQADALELASDYMRSTSAEPVSW